MTIKKIVVEKNEDVGEIIDRVLGEPDRVLVLVIPKGSTLGKSARNFIFLKRESEEAGKKVSVESVDETILALAKNAGMGVNHPLLRNQGVSGISDIVPIVREDEPPRNEEERPRGRKKEPSVRKIPVVEEEMDDKDRDEEDIDRGEIQQEEGSFFREENRFFKKRAVSSDDEKFDHAEEELPATGSRAKWITWTVAALIAIGAVLYGITVVFGSAKITITFEKTPWSYQANFTADKAVSEINATQDVIPGQVFSIPKNLTQLFPASGQENVSQKAQGVITIYNAYSSSAQTLVATTRFVTPDGKIFRLVNSVVVPGAAVTNGQIVPSSIAAAIIADQPGPDYNVSSTPKLTIPGFEGSPKYDAFYGSIGSSTSGGFIGEKAVPTATDIATAKQKVTNILTSDLQGGLTGSYTSNFKILDGATTIQITKLTVNTSTDASGNFSVFGEGTLSAIGFDETAFKAFLLSLAQSTEVSSTWSGDPNLTYTNVQPDFTNGRVSFSLSAEGSLEPIFISDSFRGIIAGEKLSDARDTIASLPELQEGTISVWPAWLWQIPRNVQKIQITVD